MILREILREMKKIALLSFVLVTSGVLYLDLNINTLKLTVVLVGFLQRNQTNRMDMDIYVLQESADWIMEAEKFYYLQLGN